MLDFSTVKEFIIPEGEVIKVEANNLILWEKPSTWDYIITPLDGSELLTE